MAHGRDRRQHTPLRAARALGAPLLGTLLAAAGCTPSEGAVDDDEGIELAFSQADHDIASDPDYVRTPRGYYHRTCVHDVGEDAILSGTRVRRADGTTYDIPPCAYPHYRAETLGPTTNGWVESGWKFAPDRNYFARMTGLWRVPPAPARLDGQILYFFPSLETSGYTAIIQPVLQFGHNGWFGGYYWTIASWKCGSSCPHSTPKRVHAGDEIRGSLTSSSCDSGVCDWTIRTTDATTGESTSLFWHAGRQMDSAQAALEAYKVDTCSEYPDSGAISFGLAVYRRDMSRDAQSWTESINPVTPQCRFDVSSSGAGNVNLFWSP